MINYFSVRNFKSLKESDLELSNLNILTGMNGMGKSSLIQALLALRQSYKHNNNLMDELILTSVLCNLGTGKDVLYQYAKNPIIEFNIVAEDIEYYFNIDYKPSGGILKLNKEKSGIFKVPNQVNISTISKNLGSAFIDENLNKLPKFPATSKIHELNLFSFKCQYLNVEHIGPRETYDRIYIDQDFILSVGIKGEYSIEYLSSYGDKYIKIESLRHEKQDSFKLIRQVEAWLSEITPLIRINTLPIPNTDRLMLQYCFETQDELTNFYTPMNVGFGITYALPVIIALLAAEKDKLLILENPEAHLHPKGQSKIGELIALAAQGGAQIIVETHSDHIINGIRVATKNGLIDSNKIKLYYFDRKIDSKEHYSFVHDMKIDSDGRIDNWPEGFMDEWDKNLMELI